ncbi:MAG: lysylphosphatidylglycerol synthase domain-containing protein [Actinomycetes bacterium]
MSTSTPAPSAATPPPVAVTPATGTPAVRDPADARDPAPADERQRNPDDLVRVVLGALVVAWMTAMALLGADVDPLERNVFRLVNELPDEIEPMLWLVMQLGSITAVPVVALVAAWRRRPRLARDVAAAGVLAYGLAWALKQLITRPRPGELLLDVLLRGGHAGLGYPSGHSAVAAVLATVLAPHLPRVARRWSWVLVVLVGVGRIYVGAHLPLDVVGGWALGWLIGSAWLLLVGSPVGVVDLDRLRGQLRAAGLGVAHVEEQACDARGSAPLAVTLEQGGVLFGKVLNSQHRSADLLFKLLRRTLYRRLEDETPFVSSKQQAEHEVLLTVLARDAGVRVTPHISLVADRPDWAIVLQDSIDGRGLDEVGAEGGLDDDLLVDVLSQVALLHEARIAHRDLRPANILADEDGHAWLVDFGFAQISASPRRLAWDVAELLAGLVPYVPPERLVDAAAGVLGDDVLHDALPMLTPAAFSSATRDALRAADGDLLGELRSAVGDRLGLDEEEEEDDAALLRVRPRTLAIVAVVGIGLYALLPQLGELPAAWEALRGADPILLGAAILASMGTYLAAGLSLAGASPASLPYPRAVAGAVAGSFASRLAPGGLGRLGLDIRLMTRAGASRAEAVAGETMLSVTGGVVHALATVVLAIGYGRDIAGNALPDGGPLLVGALVVVAVAGILSTRTEKGRELLGHAKDALRAVRETASDPQRVTQLFAGALLLNAAYIMALDHAVGAVGGDVGPGAVALVYLGGSAFAAVSPTPGGLGAVEAALVAGLSVVGVATPQAVAGVLLFRLLTYWLPTLPGWLAFRGLRARGHL